MPRNPMFHSAARLVGRVAIVTGANTGVGKETARDLYRRGARVIIACRNTAKGEAAKEDIVANPGVPVGGDPSAAPGSVEVRQLDLASLASVHSFADSVRADLERVHLLINNAGIMACEQSETADGFEMQLGTNHLGHFLLTNLLLDQLKAAAPSRVINISSLAHKRGEMHFDDLMMKNGYGRWKAYEQSKLANVLFTRELAKKLDGSGVTTYAVHPGVVKTELWRHQNMLDKVLRPFFRTAVQGAQTSLYCALATELEKESGKYYANNKEATASRRARSGADAARLWEISEKLVGMKKREDPLRVDDAN